MSTISRISSPQIWPQIGFPGTALSLSFQFHSALPWQLFHLKIGGLFNSLFQCAKSPRMKSSMSKGSPASRGPPRLLWFLMIFPIFLFPVCSSRNSPSSLHERFPSSKDISTTRNPCSFPFWERLLLWCRRGFLSSGTLVLQPRICPAQRTGFLASSHQISPPPLFIFLSERWATEFAPPTLGPSLDGQVNEKSCSIDIPLRTHWNLITSCINVRAQWEKGPG